MSYHSQHPYYYNRQYQDWNAQPAPYQSSWNQPSWSQGWLAFQDPGYLKGLLLGAGLTYILTNPKVQRALVKGAVTAWSAVQGGVEEVKEQIQDIKAEMSMKADNEAK